MGISDGDEGPSRTGTQGAQSIRRAARILRIVGGFGKPGVTVRKVAQLSSLHKATAHRILSALVVEGLLEQDPVTRNYRLGMQISLLSAVMGQRFELKELAKESLDCLAAETGDTIYLGVRSFDDVLCLDMRESTENPLPSVRLHINERWPLGIGTIGLALLASSNEIEISEILRRNSRYILAQQELTLPQIKASIQDLHLNGYVTSRNMGRQGSAAVGVPVYDLLGRALASLCVVAPVERMPPERIPGLVEMLIRESRVMSGLWCDSSASSRRSEEWRNGLRAWSSEPESALSPRRGYRGQYAKQ